MYIFIYLFASNRFRIFNLNFVNRSIWRTIFLSNKIRNEMAEEQLQADHKLATNFREENCWGAIYKSKEKNVEKSNTVWKDHRLLCSSNKKENGGGVKKIGM